jgi:hypothetical protein
MITGPGTAHDRLDRHLFSIQMVMNSTTLGELGSIPADEKRLHTYDAEVKSVCV